ncbi:MAG: hypothetical protein E5W44_13920 [Mesorhizobium sp.]|uniref:hypothetical protein n=1 Tax=Mesorhizobium sp. TaxID=1871066 RepID=UPI000FE5C434|nr:hypothetical protein [Mesorhizobium sp.]RWE28741.1 MAG: hypothetical protein EOS77_25055 [Mesorhizobium sp.]TIU10413.1 MAG: hypothetical protein E5W44_13920 [Mesorhizobium sp.]
MSLIIKKIPLLRFFGKDHLLAQLRLFDLSAFDGKISSLSALPPSAWRLASRWLRGSDLLKAGRSHPKSCQVYRKGPGQGFDVKIRY